MKKRPNNQKIGKCLICGQSHTVRKHRKTTHHLFPQIWYGEDGMQVKACFQCHIIDFNAMYPINVEKPWTVSECVQNWINFCKTKGKNAFDIYPQLKLLQPMY